jgi:ketosteroid isomerase-like protein
MTAQRRRRLVPWLLVLGTVSCAPGKPPADTAADERAINAVREREITAFSAGAVDSLLAVMDPDAVMMPPNEPIVVGTDAVRTWAQTMASQVTVNARYTGSKININGDWATERYTAVLRFTPKAGGAAAEDVLKGIHIYHRQPDGSWRIVQDVWNADAPPQAPAPPPAK